MQALRQAGGGRVGGLLGQLLGRLQRPSQQEQPRDAAPLPGRPRLLSVLGGQVRHGQPVVPTENVLTQGSWVIGRARDADLRLTDTSVSPRHALLEVAADGRTVVRDLGALNGVSVDGVPVAEAQLHDGNRLALGDVQLVFRTDPRGDDGGRQGGELGEQPDAGGWQRE